MKVTRLPTERLAAVRHPDDGHFRVHVRRGHYRISASVEGSCWCDKERTVKVRRHEIERVRLRVENVCIV